MKGKVWTAGFFAIVMVPLIMVGKWVYDIDPFFHYRKPDTSRYYYDLNSQRFQNDGISKHFDYDALITGTSMTENFKASELDEVFGVHSVKVTYSGASYKEINDNLRTALRYHPDLKIIVRALDMSMFFSRSDKMSDSPDMYPTYLYDENPWNDVKYLWNKSVIFERVYPMMQAVDEEGFVPGIRSFDEYSNWQEGAEFGLHAVCPEGITESRPGEFTHLSEEDKAVIQENITQNVTSLAKEYPEVTFYYFFPPYSAVWWNTEIASGNVYRQVEAEQYIIELILSCDNIRLYSFNDKTEITTNLNHYTDVVHYGEWINSQILRWMQRGEGLLTKENYEAYLARELDFYTSYDYESLNEQEDYEDDLEAAVLVGVDYERKAEAD